MAEDLSGLLERIRKEGVEKGRAEADRLIAEAGERAAKIIDEAELAAKALREKAEADATTFAEHGEQALRQAARDAVMSVRESVHATLRGLVSHKVTQALDAETTRELVKSVVTAFAGKDGTLEAVLPEDLRQRIGDALLGELRASLDRGVELRAAHGLRAGFRVAVKEDHVEFDFSDEAIVDALCRVVRPRLAELLEQSLGNKEAKD